MNSMTKRTLAASEGWYARTLHMTEHVSKVQVVNGPYAAAGGGGLVSLKYIVAKRFRASSLDETKSSEENIGHRMPISLGNDVYPDGWMAVLRYNYPGFLY